MNKTIIRTICIKLDAAEHDAVLTATMKAFNAAASWIARVCWDEGITNTNTAHHRVYGETRSRFGLSAQLAINARAKAVETLKSVQARHLKTCPVFGPRGSIRLDNHHSYSFKPLDHVSILTLKGRVICRMILGKRQHAMLTDPAWDIGGADLVWRRGVYYLHVSQSRGSPDIVETPDVIGVDLGISQLATTSDGEAFSGTKLQRVRQRYHLRRQRLQQVGTKSAKRRLKLISGKEHRFQQDTNHCISKSLVRKAVSTCKALVLEDLTNIQDRITVRHEQRRTQHSWAFFQLREFISYKAAQAGVAVHLIDPRNTSRTCSVCGHCEKANRKSQAEFACKSCGFTLHADHNAAINIAKKYWATVNQPMVANARVQ